MITPNSAEIARGATERGSVTRIIIIANNSSSNNNNYNKKTLLSSSCNSISNSTALRLLNSNKCPRNISRKLSVCIRCNCRLRCKRNTSVNGNGNERQHSCMRSEKYIYKENAKS